MTQIIGALDKMNTAFVQVLRWHHAVSAMNVEDASGFVRLFLKKPILSKVEESQLPL